jgi:hypothetical protein
LKKWDRKKFQRILNQAYDDPFTLLIHNFQTELEAGDMVSERLDGLGDVDEDRFEIRAWLIFGDVQHQDALAFTSSGLPKDEEKAVEVELRGEITGFPDPGVKHDFGATKAVDKAQCWTYAALTYSYDDAGRRLAHLHRHPLLERPQAIALLKACQRVADQQKAEQLGTDGSN